MIIASRYMLSVLSYKQQAPEQAESYSPPPPSSISGGGPSCRGPACPHTVNLVLATPPSKIEKIPVNHVTRSLLIASLLPKDFTGFGFVKPSGACRKAKESLHALHKAGSNQHW